MKKRKRTKKSEDISKPWAETLFPWKPFTNEINQCYVCRKEVSAGIKVLDRNLDERCLCIMCYRRHMFEEEE